MADVPRDRFAPGAGALAWEDTALPIGHGQTISQPFVVAFMTQALGLRGHERVLEIGTGSGYQTAVLSKLAAVVYTVEILPDLFFRAKATLGSLGIVNVEARLGDGYLGWPEAAPFGGILVAAAAREIPAPLVEQLDFESRLILPVGAPLEQHILVVRRLPDGAPIVETTLPVRFVPMTGQAER
jgi:protein-L-isoaspartate(D-aspartate) O-methyltransferase